MEAMIGIIFIWWVIAVIVMSCMAWAKTWSNINKAIKNQARQYDKEVEEEKKSWNKE
jgi:anionic cell wall polymer biosynthesis LytR-Cps2A-Psr (LCP) family protein